MHIHENDSSPACKNCEYQLIEGIRKISYDKFYYLITVGWGGAYHLMGDML